MKKFIKSIIKGLFQEEINQHVFQLESAKNLLTKERKEFEKQREVMENFLNNIGVSVDIEPHQYAPSWAVISIQGNKNDYIKFVNLGNAEIIEIERFLRRFDRDRMNIDAPHGMSHFIKANFGL